MSSPDSDPADNRSHPDFMECYEHTDRETGETFVAPFAVAVFGIHKEFFGVGNVIGSIDDNPVIEVLDRDDGQPYCIMGYESWWACPIPDEIIDQMASGELSIDSVAAYRQAQDDHWATVEMGDRSFAEEAGIDPESL
jgi:hypothetical protein